MATLGDIAECRLGKMLDQEKNKGELRPYLRNTNVQWGRFDLGDIKQMRIEEDERERYSVRPGDLLVCEGGEPGRCAVWREDREMYLQKALHRIRPREGVSPDYVRWWLETAASTGQLNDLFTGSTIKHLPGRQLARAPIPLPPTRVQHRIAERLNEVEQHRVAVAANLKGGRELLDRLRSAVLSAACSGRLTKGWRDGHADLSSVQPALERRTSTRRRSGKNEVTVDLPIPDLPANYVVSTIGAAAEVLEYGTSKRCTASSAAGVPVLRMGNIQAGRLDTSDLKYCEADGEIERLLLRDGDLLFNRTNSPDLVGKSAVFHGGVEMSFASYLIRVRFSPAAANPDFVNLWMNSSHGRLWARLAKTDGVSQSNINGTRLAAMPIPLPPIEEQAEIVRRAGGALATADRLAGRIEQAEETLNAISRATRAAAFRGELFASGDADRAADSVE